MNTSFDYNREQQFRKEVEAYLHHKGAAFILSVIGEGLAKEAQRASLNNRNELFDSLIDAQADLEECTRNLQNSSCPLS